MLDHRIVDDKQVCPRDEAKTPVEARTCPWMRAEALRTGKLEAFVIPIVGCFESCGKWGPIQLESGKEIMGCTREHA
jgi:ribosomal protein L40E